MFKNSANIKIFDSDALKNFHKRIFFSIIIFFCCYSIAIIRIADVMIFNIEEKNIEISNFKPERGKIYDRNGLILSSTVNSYSLFVNPLEIRNKIEIATKISPIINYDKSLIISKLNQNKKFVYLKRNLAPREHQKILQLGEINLQTHLEKKRIYPFKNNASHIIGYVNIDNIGKAGIEASYDDKLKSGKDIYLTIDINLQNAVQDELINTVKKFGAESGSVIIMNIKSSEILSLNNYPDFDLNNIGLSNLDQRLNRVLQSNYEMGSTFKPLTVAMGIDSNLIKKEMKFDVSKPIKNTIRDWDPCNCSLDVREIIVRSSNIGAAKIASLIGKKNQIAFFKKMGFYDPVGINLIEATQPFGQPYHWGEMETMTIGYGHGFAITPLHLAVAYMAILNDGQKSDPKIILEETITLKKQIIKKETSKYISTLLRAVIQETEFTGPRVKIDGYDIGGKTGTAELIDINGLYNKDLNRTIFIGAFPMYDPKYLVLTFIDKPQRIKEANNSITSATVNAPFVKKIILKMIDILNLFQQDNNIILNAATTLNHSKNNVIN